MIKASVMLLKIKYLNFCQQTDSTDIIWRTIATSNDDGPTYDNHNIFFSIATPEGDNLGLLRKWRKLIVKKVVILFPKKT